jgi:hypothetical protein
MINVKVNDTKERKKRIKIIIIIIIGEKILRNGK